MSRRECHFRVYILASRSRNLCVGMTDNLIRRITEHRQDVPGSFTARYQIHRLVHFDHYVRSALAREKELQHWTRSQKIELIGKENPTWEDLYPGMLVARGVVAEKADSLWE